MSRWGTYPGFREQRSRIRVLALYLHSDDPSLRRLLTEYGEYLDCPDWQSLKDVMNQERLEVFCASWQQGFPSSWLEEAAADKKAKVVLSPQKFSGKLPMAGIEVRGQRGTRLWVGQIGSWPGVPFTQEGLSSLRSLFRYCAVGNRPTPSSLGQALARQLWKGRREWVPPEELRALLDAHGIGARVDLREEAGTHHDEVIEADLDNAYLSVCDKLPSGIPGILRQDYEPLVHSGPNGSEIAPEWRDSTSSWWARCVVFVPEDCSLGPFPLRLPSGLVEWPTESRIYGAPGEDDPEIWLWREQVEQAISAGCTVWTIGTAYCWTSWSESLAGWAEKLAQLRDEQPDPEVQQLLKQVIVASIGWHGSRAELAEAVPLTAEATAETELVSMSEDLTMAVQRTPKRSLGYQTHWYWWTIAQVACRVYLAALEIERESGHVLHIDYDAVYWTGRKRISLFLDAKGREHIKLAASSWKQTVIHEVTFPAPRHVVSREKVRRPGIRQVRRSA